MKKNPIAKFKEERAEAVAAMAKDAELKKKSLQWMIAADKYKYSYNYTWLGRPIIKYPNDIIVFQEIIWKVKPDLIIETGIAHGGSIVFSASMLELLGGNGIVVGIDVDIRSHNRREIENHPLFKRIRLIEGDSVSLDVLDKIKGMAKDRQKIMVFLDSLHSHEHVYKELQSYAPFVSLNSYLVLPDTFIEFFPSGYFTDRPWNVGNNPYTALKEFLKGRDDFIIDREIVDKLLITESFDGYLKRVKKQEKKND